jgi:hypothetical protein
MTSKVETEHLMEVSISHYKSVENVWMKLERVTVLLGPPAVGKSNLLEATALATYFDRYALYDDVEPLPKLIRVASIRDIFTRYDLSKAVEVAVEGGGWRRSLRLHIQKVPRLELDGVEVPLKETDRPYLFSHAGRRYGADEASLLGGGRVLARLYAFDRFRDEIVNSMVGVSRAKAPRSLLREDAKNFGAVAAEQAEVFREVNAELSELGQVEVRLLDDGRVAVFGDHIAARPSDSLLRVLYYLTGLSSALDYATLRGLAGRAVVLLEEPETHPGLLSVLVKYIAKFSEVGYVVITTHSPILVSMLRDKLNVTLYYVYRGAAGFTEVTELDKDKMAEEFVTSEDILFMKPHEALLLAKR